MEVSLPLIVAGVACVIAIVLTALHWAVSHQKVKRLRAEMSAQQHQLANLKKQLQLFISSLEESQARSMVVADNTEQLKQTIAALQQQIKTLAEQDPDSRMYQRAAEMIQSGASADEVMHNCDIPFAEVQLLMNIHSNKN
ncbi:DUF2802 domain-containing protein [Alteromonas gilva]|uniref:DUF2802 domain-containing protein n=1 Tax=Alteromonas gilva TaxID=2987522 RepID=A0ABT5L0F9_9ALTE|nr:DUF2802 domain-containing protein [Alteromonas gilva]MDC8830515.1 DUF2802 domain-containing protein [Alteromonas gilva]